MRHTDGSSRILLACALASAAVHAVFMLGFVRWSGWLLPAAAPAKAADRLERPRAAEPARPLPIRLGLEKSRAPSLAWIGFERPTEHAAEQSSTEQSAFTTREAGAPLAFPEAAPEAGEPRAAPAPPAPPSPARIAESLRTLAEGLAAAERQVTQRLSGLTERLAAAVPESPIESRPAHPAATVPAQAAPAGIKSSSEASDLPGTVSDKESIATAVKKAPAVRPGQVLAGEGLEIQTRAPRWAYTTMLTRRPRNPTVRITFGADGAVRQAEFVRDGATAYNTGYDDVDQPLLNAIYGWTARGRALKDLKPGDAGVSIMITVILSG